MNDGSPLEFGVKFTSSVAGQITALKFYRSPGDTGSDLLDLWSATGTKLASATFTNTAASGWQTVNLATPVAINANTTYVASYHTTGTYVATSNFFSTAVLKRSLDRALLRLSGGNGVYSYGGTSTAGIFPTNTFSATNYWADVVFTSSRAPQTVRPLRWTTAALHATQNTALNIPGTALLANDSDPDSDPLTITGVSGGVQRGRELQRPDQHRDVHADHRLHRTGFLHLCHLRRPRRHRQRTGLSHRESSSSTDGQACSRHRHPGADQFE